MKRKLLLSLLGILIGLPISAFRYTYEGQEIEYHIIDEKEKTCETGSNAERGFKGKVILPAHPKMGDEEYTLIKISQRSFYHNEDLTEITIPNTVQRIGQEAFSRTGLTSITFPESVTYIGTEVVWGSDVTEVTLAGGGVCLDNRALPSTLKKLNLGANFVCEGNPFYTCNGLTNITLIAPGITQGWSYLSKYYNTVTLTVPESSFVDYLYSDWSNFKNITDGKQVSTTTTDNGFNYRLFQSGTTEDLNNEAILLSGNYSSLESVEIPIRLAVDGERYTVTGIGSSAFSGCKNLTSVTFNARTEIERIGATAFYDCTGLTKVDYPSLERLCNIDFESPSSNPLYYAQNLYINGVETKDVEIPTDIKEIKAYAFTGCSLNSAKYTSLEQLCSIDFGSRSSNPLWRAHNLYIGEDKIEELVVPSSIKDIKAYAFAGGNFPAITIPNSVMTIGKDAFADCTQITTVRFEDGASPLNLVAGAFHYYKDDETYYKVINDLYLGRSIANKTSLWPKNLVIGNLVTEFYNFKGNENLVSLTLGSGLTSIPADAFNGCSLSEVAVPVNVMEIGKNAFANNNGKLSKVSMGYKLASVGDKAFDGNTIETVNVAAMTPPEAPDNVFNAYSGNLYVPAEKVDEYYDSWSCWSLFAGYPLVNLQKIEGSTDKVSGKIGDTVQLSVTLTPENLSLPYVFWRSTNPEVATVDTNGLVTFVGSLDLGECKIIAETLYDTDKVATFDVNSSSTGIFEIVAEEGFEKFGGSDVERANDIFTLEGVCLKRNASKEDIDALAPGIYIVAGKKMVVK